MNSRCVNIDWLEVFCIEPKESRDADFFERHGFKITRRNYGTPQYEEMFSIGENSRFTQFEIRRKPYSVKSQGGIFPDGACHIRLTNRQCYSPTAAADLRDFLAKYDYNFRGISRVDIAADFVQFDNGDDPAEFVRRYMAGKLHKIGLSRVHVYGHDFDDNSLIVIDEHNKLVKKPKILKNGNIIAAHGSDSKWILKFNSLKWGSPSSRVSVKLYCKSQELREVKDKFYIRDCWEAAGFDPSEKVWRLEYSINSDAKDWVVNESGELFRLSFEQLRQDKLGWLWNALGNKYFRFTIPEYTRDGKPQRKDRCQQYAPFSLAEVENITPVKLTTDKEPTRTDKMLVKRLREIMFDVTATQEEKIAAKRLIKYFEQYRIVNPNVQLSVEQWFK